MKRFLQDLDQSMKTKMGVWQTGLTKLSVFFITLALVAVFPSLLGAGWELYFALSVLCAVPVIYQVFPSNGLRLFSLGVLTLLYFALAILA